ncbi:bile acid:sodium symporter family protein [Aquibacillus salsiterrae]|uniref:Bile acid:sodium symporter family protein n=1 Tax=Aquibacillus salsiterrae TaxID=2950439 RepID=A0A9X3WC76_9BACI|nr:bile acid:sodium symporter family protein [Aquibacillus salsiterrae]MDC3417107.1 bile acid:sodium symporter family protein [Aquibacillus salsiterrae]
MLEQLNRLLEKLMPYLAPISVIIGVMFGNQFSEIAFLVPWIFAFMTFVGSLSSNFQSFHRAITNPLPIVIALAMLHIIMPLWAFAVGHLTFEQDMLTITGLVIAMVIPTGVTSFIWVSMCKGNVALTLSIILIDTILSPFVVPYSLSLLVGKSVEMDVWAIMKGLTGMIVLPSIVGMCFNQITKGKIRTTWGVRLAPFSKIALAIVIMINSSVVSPYLRDVNWHLISVAVTVLFIAACGYLLSWIIAKVIKREKEVVIALTFTGGMRNISAGAVLAVAYFPQAVAVPVVVGMLFQQVLASIYGKLLNKHYLKEKHGTSSLKNRQMDL